jgi:hypothetical protein
MMIVIDTDSGHSAWPAPANLSFNHHRDTATETQEKIWSTAESLHCTTYFEFLNGIDELYLRTWYCTYVQLLCIFVYLRMYLNIIKTFGCSHASEFLDVIVLVHPKNSMISAGIHRSIRRLTMSRLV